MLFLIGSPFFMHSGPDFKDSSNFETIEICNPKSVPRDHLDSGISLLMESAFTPVINEHTVQEGLDNVLTDLTYMKLGCPHTFHFFSKS